MKHQDFEKFLRSISYRPAVSKLKGLEVGGKSSKLNPRNLPCFDAKHGRIRPKITMFKKNRWYYYICEFFDFVVRVCNGDAYFCYISSNLQIIQTSGFTKKNKPFFSLLFRMKQDAITYEFGDGRLHDNSGFLALVQRKASKVVPRLARDSPRGWGGWSCWSWEAGQVTVLFWCVWKVTVKRRGTKIDGVSLEINPPVSTCFFMNKAFRNRLDFWWVHKWGSIWRASVKVIGPAYPWDHAFILPCIMYPVY